MSWFLRCPTCAHRCELPKLFGGFTVGVEVGVMHGNYAAALLRQWTGTLHLIDPWDDSTDYSLAGLFSVSPNHDHGYNHSLAMGKIEPYKDRCHVHRERNSWGLAERIGWVDFAYIDGNHVLAHVAHDLCVWWEHLRPGGILAGHDLFQVDHPGVTEALVLFANQHRRPVHIVPGKQDCPCGEGGSPSWYIRKDWGG